MESAWERQPQTHVTLSLIPIKDEQQRLMNNGRYTHTTMALLWENLSTQLDGVRSSATVQIATSPDNDATFDGSKTRQQRLQMALEAAQKAGNSVMVNSLTAVLEGREPQVEFPSFPEGIKLQ